MRLSRKGESKNLKTICTKLLGLGRKVDVDTAKVSQYIADKIQKGDAEAWKILEDQVSELFDNEFKSDIDSIRYALCVATRIIYE